MKPKNAKLRTAYAMLMLAALAGMTGCASSGLTPQELAQIRAERNACRPATSQGGPCRTVWSANQGAMPLSVERQLGDSER